jgi:anti-sigma factor RsiW
MPTHVKREVLEQYVIGALEPHEEQVIDAHLADCDACAQVMKAEAQLELALVEVAHAPTPLRRVVRQPPSRLAALVTTVGVALAASVLFLVWRGPVSTVEPAPQVVHCDDPRSAASCIARAHFDGVITIGPDRQLSVPRYEQAGTGAMP